MEDIETIIRKAVAGGHVPEEEFSFVIKQLSEVLNIEPRDVQGLCGLIAAESGDHVTGEVVRFYHDNRQMTPVEIYKGAVSALKFVYRRVKDQDKRQIPERIDKVIRIIRGNNTSGHAAKENTGYAAAAGNTKEQETPAQHPPTQPTYTQPSPAQNSPAPQPEEPKQAERSETKPAKKRGRKKKQTTKKEEKKQVTYVPFSEFKELVDRLVQQGPYSSPKDIEDDLLFRNSCRKGQVVRTYQNQETCNPILYGNLEGLAMLHNCTLPKKPKKTSYTNGVVPGYAFKGVLYRALELYNQEDASHTQRLSTLEEEMEEYGPCQEGALAEASKKRKEQPSRLFDSLVMLVREEKLPDSKLEELRTIKEYLPSQDYEIGQLLDLPTGTGVIIDREDPDTIVVYVDEKHPSHSKMMPNPVRLRVNFHADPYSRKDESDFGIGM